MAAVIARLTIPQPEPMPEVVMVKPECRKARSPHRAGFVDHRFWRRGWDSNLLRERIEAAGTDPATLLFPHVRDVRRLIERITTETGITFCPHDLRRTFITIAESLDIPAYALKRLLNHKSGADVTAGYIVIDTERLRAPMQRITDFMLKAAGVRESATLVPITCRGSISVDTRIGELLLPAGPRTERP